VAQFRTGPYFAGIERTFIFGIKRDIIGAIEPVFVEMILIPKEEWHGNAQDRSSCGDWRTGAIARGIGGRRRFHGNYTTKLACEAHGETPAYKWEFPSEVKDGNFHGQHGEEDGPGYLVIESQNADDGSAKLSAKGKVTQNHAHGVLAMKGDNYSYNIKAQFDDAKGTRTRDEGACILGRSCTFEFAK
jgi:hypothetical protein